MDLEFIRGDTQIIRFALRNALGEPIELNKDANLYFTVKKDYNSTKREFQKRYPTDIKYEEGYYYIEIASQDTAELNYGSYVYDIELKSGSYVKTLGLGTITLTEEVTHRRDE